MTRHPVRRSARLAGIAAAIAVLVALWPSAAHAKGPFPAPPEPDGPFVVGEDTPIELRVEWPVGTPAEVRSDSLAPWPDDDPPWTLLAVEGSDPGPESFDTGEALPLTYRGDGVYDTSFRPPSAGTWVLLVAYDDPYLGWQPLDVERTIQVEAVSAEPDAAGAASGSSWPSVWVLAAVGLVAGAAAVVILAGRARAA